MRRRVTSADALVAWCYAALAVLSLGLSVGLDPSPWRDVMIVALVFLVALSVGVAIAATVAVRRRAGGGGRRG